jgi:catechol 2,3-dioxygenase-like lactoylglutathione lyase family enzyme
MPSSRFTHTSVLAKDLDESARFYGDVFGMERVPSPNFSVPVRWMRCGDLQLHLFKRDIEAVDYYHFGLHVDDFEAVYEAVRDSDMASFDVVGGTGDEVVDESPDVYALPDGSVQMYIRDPAGNLVEVNYPDVEALDRSVVTDIIDRDDLIPQTGEAARAILYHDEVLADLGMPRPGEAD